jgi:hypothetical protein
MESISNDPKQRLLAKRFLLAQFGDSHPEAEHPAHTRVAGTTGCPVIGEPETGYRPRTKGTPLTKLPARIPEGGQCRIWEKLNGEQERDAVRCLHSQGLPADIIHQHVVVVFGEMGMA